MANRYTIGSGLASSVAVWDANAVPMSAKRLRQKVLKTLPDQTVDLDLLGAMVARFAINVELPSLIAQQDYERIVQIMALAAEMADEEDIEMLLLF